MSDTPHGFEIIRDEQRRRGWYLSWRCKRSPCDSSGNSTTPDRDTALKLFDLIAEAHRSVTDDGIKEEIDV